jgi:hypothetical protein
MATYILSDATNETVGTSNQVSWNQRSEQQGRAGSQIHRLSHRPDISYLLTMMGRFSAKRRAMAISKNKFLRHIPFPKNQVCERKKKFKGPCEWNG